MNFDEKISNAAKNNHSRIVLALDIEDPDPEKLAARSRDILGKVKDFICAVKINRQLILALGLRGVTDLILKVAKDYSLPTIMDAKVNDVGHTNGLMTRLYFDAGFDCIIASPIVGWDNGLDTVFEIAKAREKAVLLLTYMSNPGAEAFYSLIATAPRGPARPVFEILANLATEWKANGVIVGATKPEIITRVSEIVGPHLPIYSPGVGVQGGDAKQAIKAGARYLIVGRSIYDASDPANSAKTISKLSFGDGEGLVN